MSDPRPPEMIPEPIDPDLRPFVRRNSWGGWMVHHPLVIDVMLPSETTCLPWVNASYHQKSEVLNKLIDETDWSQYVFMHERPYRVSAFLNVAYLMEDEEYWELLRSMWTDTENLHEWGDDTIRDLFDQDNPELFMTEGDRWEWDQIEPTAESEVIIYRGYCHPDAKMGWSWTMDLNRAEWFARRFASATDGTPHVVTARVQKDAVLGYLNDRIEYEVVVDPENVRVTFDNEVKDD